MKLKIGYFYPNLLNLYGDTGNIEILVSRCKKREISVEVTYITIGTPIEDYKDVNLIFMGGGPDASQKAMYHDLFNNKKDFIIDYIENFKVALFICGSYQLVGHYYKAADGTVLEGLGAVDFYTCHFGKNKPRCIGNITCVLNSKLVEDPVFKRINHLGNTIVGFENHGGRTYLGSNVSSLAKVVRGYGNNGEDGTEGFVFKNSFGSYLHGPVLSRNPHLADLLIAKSIGTDQLVKLDDELIYNAHTASLNFSK